MAHFAQLDSNSVVTQVIVVSNDELIDNGVESEAKGIAFCQSLFGVDTHWVQTSYNRGIRKNYAGIGYTYDAARDAVISPKPKEFPSFILDEESANWIPPVSKPNDGKHYSWSEKSQVWVEMPVEFLVPPTE